MVHKITTTMDNVSPNFPSNFNLQNFFFWIKNLQRSVVLDMCTKNNSLYMYYFTILSPIIKGNK